MIILYILLIIGYTILSFAKTDPNLVFSYHPTFMQFQKYMWHFGLESRLIFSIIYFLIISLLFLTYLRIISRIKNSKITVRSAYSLTFASSTILLLANPALSHDLFNYIFNAKMVVAYQANPHIKVALDFASDSWVQFMHNTHTPAPYGYGWTLLSLIPYSLGFGRLKITMLAFKLFIGMFFYMLLYFQRKIQKVLRRGKDIYLLFVFALNPLVLIETFGNGHNDVVMMGLLFMTIYTAWLYIEKRKMTHLILAILAFGLSVSIKLASVMILPSILVIWIYQTRTKNHLDVGSTGAIMHAVPLLTSRSQRYLPWYGIWPFSFLPLIKNKRLMYILIAFTFSGLMRYLPSLYFPLHNRGISDQSFRFVEQAITFIIPLVSMIFYARYNSKKEVKK